MNKISLECEQNVNTLIGSQVEQNANFVQSSADISKLSRKRLRNGKQAQPQSAFARKWHVVGRERDARVCGLAVEDVHGAAGGAGQGKVVIGGITGRDVVQAIELAVAMRENVESMVLAPDYMDANVSVKVVKIIQSYVKIVDKMVWGK